MVIHEFWYHYVEAKCMKKIKIMLHGYIQLYSLCKSSRHLLDTAKDVETRFDTLNYKLERPLPEGKNKKVLVLMKDDWGGKIITCYCIESKYMLLFKRQKW